ncbi:MAG TPA: DUF4956 domain-containing protein [Saprospiraceae bacterium]|nr:DUF4956 domain-containing protein [Saprospiraceae bacterium]HND87929.1 DUF4956 domain-containing protein [Saprospiraceae bacterium]
MQEFLSLYSKIQNPTFEMVLFTFLMAFLCASAIALTYYWTSPGTFKTPNFIQSLLLSSVIATMIVQSIGDNVGAGLGMIGALTIINFRTSFRDPRDIVFMFAALGAGIACGSYVFIIAATGTLGFCFVAFALRYTPFHQGNHLVWELRVRVVQGKQEIARLEQMLEDFCLKWDLEMVRNNDRDGQGGYMERDYVLIFKNDQTHSSLLDTLRENGIAVRRFNKQNSDFTANEI